MATHVESKAGTPPGQGVTAGRDRLGLSGSSAHQGEQFMNGVHLSGPTNSTMFTDCCGVAITDNEGRCPLCGEEVFPGDEATHFERRTDRWEMAYGPTRRRLEKRYAALRK